MAVAKARGVDLDLVQVDYIGETRKKLLNINPLGQIPVFVAPDGFLLTECIPITLYSEWSVSDSDEDPVLDD